MRKFDKKEFPLLFTTVSKLLGGEEAEKQLSIAYKSSGGEGWLDDRSMSCAFSWGDTDQGYTYWSDVFNVRVVASYQADTIEEPTTEEWLASSKDTPVGYINVPFGAELYVSVSGKIIMWFKQSDGVILQCNAPKSSSIPQYPFWEVSEYPSIEVLDASFGSSLKYIHKLGEEGVDWVEMER